MTSMTVVVPTWEGSAEWLGDCLASLRDQVTDEAFTVLVVFDGDVPTVQEIVYDVLPSARTVRQPKRRGFATAATAGLRAAKGDFIAVVNDDVVLDPGWVAGMFDAAGRHPDVGFFASRVVTAADPLRIDSAGHGLTRWGEAFEVGAGCLDGPDYDTEREVFGAPASAAVYRRELIEDCKGFDTTLEAYLEDVELSLRARLLGFSCLYVPTARATHRGRASYGSAAERLLARNQIRMLARTMPRAALRAAAPAAVVHLSVETAYGLLRGRPGAATGLVDGVTRITAAIGERGATLGRRRTSDEELLGALRASEERLRELGRSPASLPRKARLSISAGLTRWVDRRQDRLDRPLW
ncbi:MAG: glycosyltransferase [Proteobacteria bacterium]|nr:glycosyltransferase [Pseudomonadota bacterium]